MSSSCTCIGGEFGDRRAEGLEIDVSSRGQAAVGAVARHARHVAQRVHSFRPRQPSCATTSRVVRSLQPIE